MHSAKLIFTFFLLALISFSLGAPTPNLITTNILSTIPETEVQPRTFSNGFGLLSALDARAIYSLPIEIESRKENEEGEVLEERQNCGAPFCNAGMGLRVPAFPAMLMAMAVVAVGGVVMG
ncbi:hypothetical protein ACMFMG_000710 [Clarireedia jacksonii]